MTRVSRVTAALAAADPGWVLDSWDGACSGAEGCSIHISGHQQVTARFKPPVQPKPPLNIVFDAVDVSHLDGPSSVTYAQVLDDTGAIAGGICDAPVPSGMACDFFLWDGALHRFHVPDGTADVGATAGDRVAGAIRTASGVRSAFVTSGEQIVELPTLSGDSFAGSINGSGVVGGASFTPSGELDAVVWKDGALEDLGARTGKTESIVQEIDESGKVSVLACDRFWRVTPSGCHALVMTGEAQVDLGTIPDGFLLTPR
jgi:hypothetical protein